MDEPLDTRETFRPGSGHVGDMVSPAAEVTGRITGPFEVDGRPIINVEMWRAIHEELDRREEIRDRDGCCCEEGPYKGGICRHGVGPCPLYQQAKRILWREDHERERDEDDERDDIGGSEH